MSPVATEKDLFSGFPVDPSEEKEHDSLRAKTLGGRLKILVERSEMKGPGRREIAMEQRVTPYKFESWRLDSHDHRSSQNSHEDETVVSC